MLELTRLQSTVASTCIRVARHTGELTFTHVGAAEHRGIGAQRLLQRLDQLGLGKSVQICWHPCRSSRQLSLQFLNTQLVQLNTCVGLRVRFVTYSVPISGVYMSSRQMRNAISE
jgi:hypothetical protein